MTFAEKLRKTRLTLNMSQGELAEKVGLNERSIYCYEQTGAYPRKKTLDKLAAALGVTVEYLTEDGEKAQHNFMSEELFIAESKARFGSKGAREAEKALEQASALFAGGELDESARAVFIQSIMTVFLESKEAARKKFSPRQRASKRTDSGITSTEGEE